METAQKQKARERLLTTASRLFFQQGYAQTGINQIISEADTAKASFYQHFDSKQGLGIMYLREFRVGQLQLLRKLAEKYAQPNDFMNGWTRILRRQVDQKAFHGCAMANLHAQTSDDENALRMEVRQSALETLGFLESMVRRWQSDSAVGIDCVTPPPVLARRLLAVYEGVLHTMQITHDPSGLDDFVPLALAVLHS